MAEQIVKLDRYDIPNSGGMKFIGRTWVFTGGGAFYKIEEREPGDWIVVHYNSGGQFDGGVFSPGKMTEDEAHAMAQRLVLPREERSNGAG